MNGPVTLFHNPDCGTSRNTLALIRACGIEPRIVEYLKNPPDRATLQGLIARTGLGVRALMRVRGTPYHELGLDDPGLDDAALIGQMLAHPILINRPLVATATGVRLCRPSDLVMELVTPPPGVVLYKEDGSPVLRDRPVDSRDEAFRQALRDAGLPTADLDESGCRVFAFATTADDLVGHGGYELHGPHLLVRSVVVPPAARGQGVGAGIVALLLRRGFDAGARHAWLLTTDAPDYFARHGFKAVARSDAPEAILRSPQAMSLCPASATLMTRAITP